MRAFVAKHDRHATRRHAASRRVDDFPSMKARRLLAILMREPLSYRVVRHTGSHRWLAASGHPSFPFAFHDRRELSPREARKVPVKAGGLAEPDARDLL